MRIQTLRTPFTGARYASCVPSGEMVGSDRSGLPNRTERGINSVSGRWICLEGAFIAGKMKVYRFARASIGSESCSPPLLQFRRIGVALAGLRASVHPAPIRRTTGLELPYNPLTLSGIW